MNTTSNSPSDEPKTDRIEARVSSATKKLLEHAASISGQTLTSYVLSVLTSSARQTIESHNETALTFRESRAFVDLLFASPKPNRALQQAAAEHSKRVSLRR